MRGNDSVTLARKDTYRAPHLHWPDLPPLVTMGDNSPLQGIVIDVPGPEAVIESGHAPELRSGVLIRSSSERESDIEPPTTETTSSPEVSLVTAWSAILPSDGAFSAPTELLKQADESSLASELEDRLLDTPDASQEARLNGLIGKYNSGSRAPLQQLRKFLDLVSQHHGQAKFVTAPQER